MHTAAYCKCFIAMKSWDTSNWLLCSKILYFHGHHNDTPWRYWRIRNTCMQRRVTYSAISSQLLLCTNSSCRIIENTTSEHRTDNIINDRLYCMVYEFMTVCGRIDAVRFCSLLLAAVAVIRPRCSSLSSFTFPDPCMDYAIIPVLPWLRTRRVLPGAPATSAFFTLTEFPCGRAETFTEVRGTWLSLTTCTGIHGGFRFLFQGGWSKLGAVYVRGGRC